MKHAPGDQVLTPTGDGYTCTISYAPVDPVEYEICQKRGHDFNFYAKMAGEPDRCRWCGLRVQHSSRRLNAPVTVVGHVGSLAK